MSRNLKELINKNERRWVMVMNRRPHEDGTSTATIIEE
jgi:hypothetical protein